MVELYVSIFSARVSKLDKDNLLNLAVSLNPLFIDNIELNQFERPSFIGLNITLFIILCCGDTKINY